MTIEMGLAFVITIGVVCGFVFYMVTGTQKIIDAKTDALNAKIEAKTDALNAKIEAKTDALNAKIEDKTNVLDAKIEAKTNALDAKIDAIQNQLTEIRADIRTLVADRFEKNPNVG